MTQQVVLQFLAVIFLVCAFFVGLVDFGWHAHIDWIIKLKWSLGWYAARFVGIGCGVLMALDILL